LNNRPGGAGGNRLPDARPGGGLADGRPGNNLPGGRPGPGDVGRPANRPGNVNPGQLGDFLGVGNVRPGVQRPSWSNNLRPDRVTHINNTWNTAIRANQNSFRQWNTLHPERGRYWGGWAGGVRNNWGALPNRPWFGPGWWGGHPFARGWWHYGYLNRPWNTWWRPVAWAGIASWFAPWGWNNDNYNYYDYGSGGNVTYQDNNVQIDGQPLCTTEEFAQSAAELAAVEPPADEQAAAAAEWLPLGTFALSTSADDDDLSRIVQLAVDKQGIVSGTLVNTKTDQSLTVQGRVDKDTQRVALMLVERPEIVLETGLYNLTQAEAPALIHFGADKSEQALLVRLEEPPTEGAAPQ
jgi:hypothetical protein